MKAYLWNCLISLDQSVNTFLGPLLNILLNTSTIKFGFPDETVSSVLGKMKLKGEGNRLSSWLASFLNTIDPNHVEDSIEKNEGSRM